MIWVDRRRLLALVRGDVGAAGGADASEERVGVIAQRAAPTGEAAELNPGVALVAGELKTDPPAGAHVGAGGIEPVEMGAAAEGRQALTVARKVGEHRRPHSTALRLRIAAGWQQIVGGAAQDRLVAAEAHHAIVGAGAVGDFRSAARERIEAYMDAAARVSTGLPCRPCGNREQDHESSDPRMTSGPPTATEPRHASPHAALLGEREFSATIIIETGATSTAARGVAPSIRC